MQLYVAIIASLLLRLFKDKYAKAHQASIKHLMARLKVALLAPLNLTDTAKPPPRCPRLRPPNPQTGLVFS